MKESLELFVVMVEFENETFVGSVFDSEELAKGYISALSTKTVEDDPMNDYVEVGDSLYVLIEKCNLNEQTMVF